jgi:hypothetical protein
MNGEEHPAKEGKAMETKELQNHLRLLATLPADDASPLLSVFLDVSAEGYNETLEARVQALRPAYKGQARADLELAYGQVKAWLASRLFPETKGVVVYARAGQWPHLQGLQFAVPVQDHVGAGDLPQLGPLVELKDDYERYVIFVALKDAVRILEVDLGAVTRELWSRHPYLREKASEVWGRRHWDEKVDRQEPKRFWDAKLKLLDRLMHLGGHSHLILAGDPEQVRTVRAQLPKHLKVKVMELLAAQPHDRVDDVVQQTLASFLSREEQHSQDRARDLAAEVKRGGLGVAGMQRSLKALRLGAVETLLVSKGAKHPQGWVCRSCGEIGLASGPAACPACAGKVKPADLKEEAVRLAQASGAHVEAVGAGGVLDELGGVGCLLRFKPDHVSE